MKQFKNYVGFANDHSGSMSSLERAAIRDSNANTQAIRDAASREMLDTVVSVVGFNSRIERQIVNSNPHVLKPVTSWPTQGMTAMYDAIGDLITLFKSLPDANEPHVSFLIMVTTDGEENSSSRWNKLSLAQEIAALQRSERWTFVFRVPHGRKHYLNGLGIPDGNIQEWDTTAAGMAQSTAVTTQAIDTYYAARSTGKRGSNTFYATAAVDPKAVEKKLVDVSAEVQTWAVLPSEGGMEIKDFAESRLGNKAPFLKGAAFYQLTKTEARVQADKLIVIRDKAVGKLYSGPEARSLIGLPPTGTVRVKPDATPQFDIFIQSTSINRKLVEGTQVLYWPKQGTGFTAADFPWLANNGQVKPDDTLSKKAAHAIQATTAIPAPTVAGVIGGRAYYPSRSAARLAATAMGKSPKDAGRWAPDDKRWYVEI